MQKSSPTSMINFISSCSDNVKGKESMLFRISLLKLKNSLQTSTKFQESSSSFVIADSNGFNNLTMASLSCQNVSSKRVRRTSSDKLLLFFSGSSETAILHSTTLFLLTLSKLVTIEAHLVFTGNPSVQFTFSAFCTAFNMSTSICLCLNSFMTTLARFIIVLQVSSFIISQKIKLRPCAAHPQQIIVGYFSSISRHAFFCITCVVCDYSKNHLAAPTF